MATWVQIAGAMRQILSLCSATCHEQRAHDQDNEAFQLSLRTHQELLLWGVLAPTMRTSLVARHSEQIVRVDASDTGLSGAHAPISREEHRQLWRHRPLRSTRSKLASRLELALARMDPKGEADHIEERDAWRATPHRILSETFDFVEICCGPSAPLMAAHAKEGMRCGPRIDIKLHPMWDLRLPRILEWILFMIYEDRVWYWHWAIPCGSFSLALWGQLRSLQYPEGYDRSEPRTSLGNLLLTRAVLCLSVLQRHSSRHGSLEQPRWAD